MAQFRELGSLLVQHGFSQRHLVLSSSRLSVAREGPLELSSARPGKAPFVRKNLRFSGKIAPSPAGHKFGVLGPGLTMFGPMALLLARLGVVLDELGLAQAGPGSTG